MSELMRDNWWLFLIALLIGIAVAWWIFVANRKTRVKTTRADTLDEGAERARRNQALIDAPAGTGAAPVVPPVVPGTIAGAGGAEAAMMEGLATPQPAPKPAPAPSPAAPAGGDDLKRIKGVGPKLEKLLQSLGVTSYAQIAAWNEEDVDRIDAQLGTFAGRIRRDSWIEQAKFLAAGDTAGFEGKFGKV